MATITPNLKLTKPGYEDLFDISIWDDNMDIIDQGVAANGENIDMHEGRIYDLEEQMVTHKHSASDITSGTLPIVRGGTGASTASGAVDSIGAAHKVHEHNASDVTSGTLPIMRGGTGAGDAAGALENIGAAAKSHKHAASDITMGQLSPSIIPNLDASKINSGVFDAGRIPNLDASKITSGTLATARIPNLDASKITSGTFAVDRIPSLDASKINSGVFGTARIPNLDASKINSGVFGVDRIPSLGAGKITSGVLDVARGGTSVTSYAALANKLKLATGQKFVQMDLIGDWFDDDDCGGGTHEGGDRSGKAVSYDCPLSANPFSYDLILCCYGPKIYLQFDGSGDYYEGGFAVMPMWVTTKSDAGHRVADNFIIDFSLVADYNYFDSYAKKRYPDIVKVLGENNSTNTSYIFCNRVNLTTNGGNRATISCGNVAMQNSNGNIHIDQFYDVVTVTKKVNKKTVTHTYKYLCCMRLYGMLGIKFV